MSGHGWVTPNPDGSRARCGGPAICGACAREKAAAEAAIAARLNDAGSSARPGGTASERKCECREFRSGLPCGRTAAWLVQVGTRKADAQLSCPRHLSMTCEVMRHGEGREAAALTVTAVTP